MPRAIELKIEKLISNNEEWAKEIRAVSPTFFEDQARGQEPEFLWIGCADSRVPPDVITKTQPGDIFVHRNIANLVISTDMNILSVLQYAVDVLQVKHVIVCGHYGCGGVKAAMGTEHFGLIDNWLRQIKDTQNYYWQQLQPMTETERFDRLVELSVIEQVYNLGKTNTVQNAWERGQCLYLHGWVYDIRNGHINQQASMINSEEKLKVVCKFEKERVFLSQE